MKTDLAFEHALNGQAILFIGSGFSLNAINLRGGKFKTGSQLAQYFSEQTGLDINSNLTIAAEEYEIKFGKDKLISELQKEFSVKNIHESHLLLAAIPWKRIYTTNYDNVMETAYSNIGKKLLATTPGQDIRQLPKNVTLCVHLNGHIDQLSKATLDNEFKLTDGSYIASSIASSTWGTQFRDDIQSAKAVFFVGYSLVDLDIQRLLFSTTTLKDKCFFVVGENPSRTTKNRAMKFGEMVSVTTSSFAKKINGYQKLYTPPEDLEFFGECLQHYDTSTKTLTLQDKDVFDLFLYGKFHQELIAHSLLNDTYYYCERNEINHIFNLIDKGERIIVLHSELGNGKTLLIEGVKYIANQRGYDVFDVSNRTSELKSEIDEVTRSYNKSMLIFENYFEWHDAIRLFIDNSSEKCVAILSSRSSAYDVTIDELCDFLKIDNVPQINLDKLSDENVYWIVDAFDRHGIWAKSAARSRNQKYARLRRYPTFSSILVSLLKSPYIISKFDEILQQLNERRDYYKVIVSILVLTTLGYKTSVNRLIDFWGEAILDIKFKRNPAIAQIVEFDHGDVNIRSSVFAKYILNLVVDGKIIVDTIIEMRRKAEEKYNISYFRTLSKKLMRFNHIQNLLPEKNKKNAVLHYYESIKNLPSTKENPLFWLQYGIACLVLKEYERTERYLQTAYSYAEKTPYFDKYQIDNHYARFLLEKSIKYRKDSSYMDAFREAKKIIGAQIRRESVHYPYKVAQLYADFYNAYEPVLSSEEKTEIAEVASSVLKRIYQLPDAKQEQNYISRCQTNMVAILEKVAEI